MEHAGGAPVLTVQFREPPTGMPRPGRCEYLVLANRGDVFGARDVSAALDLSLDLATVQSRRSPGIAVPFYISGFPVVTDVDVFLCPEPYAPQWRRVSGLRPGGRHTIAGVPLEPGGTVSGTVIASDGRPFATVVWWDGLDPLLVASSKGCPSAPLFERLAARTDAEGRFQLRRVNAGKRRIRVGLGYCACGGADVHVAERSAVAGVTIRIRPHPWWPDAPPSKEPYGADLARRVADQLVRYGPLVQKPDRDSYLEGPNPHEVPPYYGQGFALVDGRFRYGDANDGVVGAGIVFETRAEFEAWLARQSDDSLSGRDEHPTFAYNKRVTRDWLLRELG